MSDTHFDAVIVGSGFGGSVMALRLAQAGRTVCVLERGRAYPPGSFPRSPFKMSRNFWDPSRNLFGMFNIWSFRHIGALISSGLGGGSLIYANVLLRKDEKWFVREGPGGVEDWPVTREDLDPYYDLAERMLDAQRYPLEDPPYDATRKTLAMREAGRRMAAGPEYGGRLSWDLVPLAVSFRRRPWDPQNPADPANPPVVGEPLAEPAELNLHGRTRTTCRLCGECDVGCNYGSKNTLDFNYLSQARRLGAEIRTLSEVKSFKPLEKGGYAVDYVTHRPDPENPGKTPGRLTCNRLVLAAGTLGSTYLLLRNRANLPGLSQALGSRFCGNGDLLSFAVKARDRHGPRIMDGSFGPVITSALRVSDALDGGRGRGYYIEDAGYPDFINWMIQTADFPGAIRRSLRFAKQWLLLRMGLSGDPDLGAEISDMFGDSALSKSSLPLLGMGRDVPDGRMRLDGSDRLQIDWKIDRSSEFFNALRKTMADTASVWGADFRVNPTYRLGRRLITVHPLGGCPMSDDPKRGVVDSFGRVHNCPGLQVIDGSILPGPVGANPSLTIAALAERAAQAVTSGRPERSQP